jgi:hypothetical protein
MEGDPHFWSGLIKVKRDFLFGAFVVKDGHKFVFGRISDWVLHRCENNIVACTT